MTKIKNFKKKFIRKIAVKFNSIEEMQEFLYNCELNDIYFLNGHKIEDETREYDFYHCIKFKANRHWTKDLFHISKNNILLSDTEESFWEELGFKVLNYNTIIQRSNKC